MAGAFLKLTRGDRHTLMREEPWSGSWTAFSSGQRRFEAGVRFSMRDEPGEIEHQPREISYPVMM